MINLLPDGIKKEIIYGKRNRILVGWIFTVVAVIIAVGTMTVFGKIYISKNTDNIQSITELTKQRIEDQDLASTQKDVETLSNNFKTVTQLLSKQLLFSKLFVKIGSIIPDKAILSGITLSTEELAIDLNIAATNRDAATQSFVNISDTKNGLFDKADLLSVSCNTGTAEASSMSSKYPCVAMIKVVMKADSNYYFLNSVINGGS